MSDSILVWLTVTAIATPLVAALSVWLAPERFASRIATVVMLVSSCTALWLFFAVDTMDMFVQVVWFTVGTKEVHAGLAIGPVTAVMLAVVSVVSTMVHLYSVEYMRHERSQKRFYSWLSFFTFAMMGLVASSNLIQIFLFWELVGVASYFLIGFWYHKPEAAQAATKAVLMNRVGDVALLSGFAIVWVITGNLDLKDFLFPLKDVSVSELTIAGTCIAIGLFSKSAQLPFSSWLPDAMEGPTPVSALLHAATMVAAGVYLGLRLGFIFTPFVLTTIAIVGSITACVGALSALFATNTKRILAHSTISQLGFMFVGIGTAAQVFALHLVSHAFFKAALFLVTGVMVARDDGNQRTPWNRSYSALLIIPALSLAGVPLTSGYISKEILLSGIHDPRFQMVAVILSLLTACYVFRLLWLNRHLRIATRSPAILLPLALLAMLSTAPLWSINPLTMDGQGLFGLGLTGHLDQRLVLVSVATVATGMLATFFIVRRQPLPTFATKEPAWLSLDTIIHGAVVKPVLATASVTSRIDQSLVDPFINSTAVAVVMIAHIASWFDRYIVDGLVNLSASISNGVGNLTRANVQGKVQSYILWASTGLLVIIALVLLKR